MHVESYFASDISKFASGICSTPNGNGIWNWASTPAWTKQRTTDVVDRNSAGRLFKSRRSGIVAPEIVWAMQARQERENLSLRQLRRGVTLLWEEQRQLWALKNPDR